MERFEIWCITIKDSKQYEIAAYFLIFTGKDVKIPLFHRFTEVSLGYFPVI